MPDQSVDYVLTVLLLLMRYSTVMIIKPKKQPNLGRQQLLHVKWIREGGFSVGNDYDALLITIL